MWADGELRLGALKLDEGRSHHHFGRASGGIRNDDHLSPGPAPQPILPHHRLSMVLAWSSNT